MQGPHLARSVALSFITFSYKKKLKLSQAPQSRETLGRYPHRAPGHGRQPLAEPSVLSAKKDEFQAWGKGGRGVRTVALGMAPQERAFLSHVAPKEPLSLEAAFWAGM